MTWRTRITVSLITFVAVVVFFYLFLGNPLDPLDAGKDPASGHHVGKTKEAIVKRFGQPSHEWQGHYGAPPLEYTSKHDPAVTFTYKRWTGTHYLSFKFINGEWVCFASDWMPNGWVW